MDELIQKLADQLVADLALTEEILSADPPPSANRAIGIRGAQANIKIAQIWVEQAKGA